MTKLALTLPGFNSSTGITITDPSGKYQTLLQLVSAGLEVVFYISFLLMFFWMLWGVFRYLTAEGEKEQLKRARNQIRWALVGFIVIMLAFFIGSYLQDILEIKPVPLTRVSGDTPGAGIIDRVLQLLPFGDKGPAQFKLGSCTSGGNPGQPGVECVPLHSFMQAFMTDCNSADCVKPSYTIPYLYHQYDVKLNNKGEGNPPSDIDEYQTYNCTEAEMVNATNPGGAACAPSSLAMVAEAFNQGRRDPNTGIPFGYNHTTAGDLTRFFLNRRLMSCKDGTDTNKIEGYLNGLDYSTREKEFHVDIQDIVDGSFGSLVTWYKNSGGLPIVTNVYYAGDGVSKHYVTIAGISDRYVWVADPLSPGPSPEQQYIFKFDKQNFENRYYKGRFWKIAPILSETPGTN